MSVTSFYFLCFFALVLIIYYLVPLIFKGKGQWVVLLLASITYYLLSGNGVLILYPLLSSLLTWGLLQLLGRLKEEDIVKRRLLLAAELLGLLGVLIGLKYTRFIHGGSIATPLGLSFYTFILLGYFIEVYNGIGKGQKSFLKTALYGMYFPVMISGPIFQTRQSGDQFFEHHPLDYKNITFGIQRMLWGFFKELVISERLATVVNTIYDNDTQYQGAYIWLGTVCFAFQLYTNFSGCMDIVIGISETFGIVLPENFKTPFFAKNISEYWRRWHATLGTWMKDNVFYPLLRSKMITSLGKTLKGKLGKKKGKQYTTYVAMLILWFSVGMWHGGEMKYVIGSGLLHWAYIVIGEITLPFFTWLFAEKMHMNLKSKAADAFRVVRTFFLVCIGDLFFRSDNVPHALRMLKESVTVFNPQVLVNGSVLGLGLDFIEWGILLVSLAVLITVSTLQYRMEGQDGPSNIRELIASKGIVLRWVIFIGLLFYVILLAEYGPGYSAAEFIYKDF
ncbi:MBOAT family O-acyltransferase [Butyrivibrio sp. NC2007]|uniref:MBOAT family O-acyltransferase n=1 Tax=Butyrivibrio sp. NC2007 TaxID=1280683 RepID=UPI0003B5C018|nr:MBOAT family O-acyltransferase [Butyrivibrio sp. NC2007]